MLTIFKKLRKREKHCSLKTGSEKEILFFLRINLKRENEQQKNSL